VVNIDKATSQPPPYSFITTVTVFGINNQLHIVKMKLLNILLSLIAVTVAVAQTSRYVLRIIGPLWIR